MKSAFACALVSAVLGLGAAQAETPEVAFNAGVVSDYVFRGASQTGGNAALQGGVDVDWGAFYLGSWASNVDFGDDTDAEIDLSVGHHWLDVSGDYATWNLGAAYALTDQLALDVRYHDMDSPQAEDRVTAGLKFNF